MNTEYFLQVLRRRFFYDNIILIYTCTSDSNPFISILIHLYEKDSVISCKKCWMMFRYYYGDTQIVLLHWLHEINKALTCDRDYLDVLCSLTSSFSIVTYTVIYTIIYLHYVSMYKPHDKTARLLAAPSLLSFILTSEPMNILMSCSSAMPWWLWWPGLRRGQCLGI